MVVDVVVPSTEEEDTGGRNIFCRFACAIFAACTAKSNPMGGDDDDDDDGIVDMVVFSSGGACDGGFRCSSGGGIRFVLLLLLGLFGLTLTPFR